MKIVVLYCIVGNSFSMPLLNKVSRKQRFQGKPKNLEKFVPQKYQPRLLYRTPVGERVRVLI